MGMFEAIVVFVISWWLVFLPTLSAGTRSQHEAGAVVPGSERGAPEAHLVAAETHDRHGGRGG